MASEEHWVDSLDDLLEFLSLVLLHAPDDFPEEDYLSPSEQLNLERAFAEIQRGLDLLARDVSAAELATFQRLVDGSLEAYSAGEAVRGARLLQDFERLAFPGSFG